MIHARLSFGTALGSHALVASPGALRIIEKDRALRFDRAAAHAAAVSTGIARRTLGRGIFPSVVVVEALGTVTNGAVREGHCPANEKGRARATSQKLLPSHASFSGQMTSGIARAEYTRTG